MEYLAYKIDEINIVSEYECALIFAKIEEVMDEKKTFNCYHCKTKNKNKETTQKERTIKGCFDATVKYTLENISYSYCLGNYCFPSAGEALLLFIEFEKGLLPDAGGLLDQSAKIMQVFDVIRARREEKREKDKQETHGRKETRQRVDSKLQAKRLKDGKRNKDGTDN